VEDRADRQGGSPRSVGRPRERLIDDYRIDLPAILGIAHLGVRRATVFSTFGANAARGAVESDFDPLACGAMEVIPAPPDQTTLDSYKKEFEKWVVVCALREAIEAFALFLDHIHLACVIMAHVEGRVTVEQADKWGADYSFLGLAQKLRLLRERFGVEFADADMLLSINAFRNCLSHRRGVVGPEDCAQDGSFVVVWPGIELFSASEDGEERRVGFPVDVPVVMEAGAGLLIRTARKTTTFKLGDQLRLSPTQVTEAGQFLAQAAEAVCKSAQSYAEGLGLAGQNSA